MMEEPECILVIVQYGELYSYNHNLFLATNINLKH